MAAEGLIHDATSSFEHLSPAGKAFAIALTGGVILIAVLWLRNRVGSATGASSPSLSYSPPPAAGVSSGGSLGATGAGAGAGNGSGTAGDTQAVPPGVTNNYYYPPPGAGVTPSDGSSPTVSPAISGAADTVSVQGAAGVAPTSVGGPALARSAGSTQHRTHNPGAANRHPVTHQQQRKSQIHATHSQLDNIVIGHVRVGPQAARGILMHQGNPIQAYRSTGTHLGTQATPAQRTTPPLLPSRTAVGARLRFHQQQLQQQTTGAAAAARGTHARNAHQAPAPAQPHHLPPQARRVNAPVPARQVLIPRSLVDQARQAAQRLVARAPAPAPAGPHGQGQRIGTAQSISHAAPPPHTAGQPQGTRVPQVRHTQAPQASRPAGGGGRSLARAQ